MTTGRLIFSVEAAGWECMHNSDQNNRQPAARTEDFAWIVVAYLVAVGVALVALWWSAELDSLWRAAIADVCATLVIFVFSRAFANSSFYDAYWSVAPPLLLLFWLLAADVSLQAREGLLGMLVLLWSIRLTHNWARGWQGLSHVDWRYVDLRQQTGAWYPLVDLLGIQLMPTALVFLGCLPLWLITHHEATGLPQPAWQWWDFIWLSVGAGSLWLEFRADNVLRAFRLQARSKEHMQAGPAGKVLQHDVWAWCRHPNYLGELGFWFSLALAGYLTTADPLAWLGFVAMVLLFTTISIPMIDKRQLANKAEYAAYRDAVPALIPSIGRWRDRLP